MLEQFLSNAKKSIMEADTAKAEEIAKQALAEGMNPGELLENGYVPGIVEMGDLFEDEKIFLPELMRSAETMKAASEICNAAIKNPDINHKRTVAQIPFHFNDSLKEFLFG